MCYGTETGYGMLLFAEEIRDFVRKLAKLRGHDVEDILAYERISALSYDNGYGSWEAIDLTDEGENDDSDGDAYFIYAKKQGGVTNDPANLYSNLDEMADEFRKEYGGCLPKDFDYTSRLCFLRASLW